MHDFSFFFHVTACWMIQYPFVGDLLMSLAYQLTAIRQNPLGGWFAIHFLGVVFPGVWHMALLTIMEDNNCFGLVCWLPKETESQCCRCARVQRLPSRWAGEFHGWNWLLSSTGNVGIPRACSQAEQPVLVSFSCSLSWVKFEPTEFRCWRIVLPKEMEMDSTVQLKQDLSCIVFQGTQRLGTELSSVEGFHVGWFGWCSCFVKIPQVKSMWFGGPWITLVPKHLFVVLMVFSASKSLTAKVRESSCWGGVFWCVLCCYHVFDWTCNCGVYRVAK